MKAKNISDRTLNLISGKIEPGGTGEFTTNEYMFLRNQGFIGAIEQKPVIKRVIKKDAAK